MSNEYKRTVMILGGDGYLGWTLGLAIANRTNDNVVLVDNMVKRKWEKQVDAKLLVPLKSPQARVRAYKKIYGKNNMTFEKVELLDAKATHDIIAKYRPTHIINAAQQPSAPFSMQSAEKAGLTYTNNIVGHLNAIWAIAQIDKNITYIKLGSAGVFMDTDCDYLPLDKQNFTFEHKGKTRHVQNAIIPMQATDFYHQSKITDTLIDDMTTRMWGLKSVTVMQATIFGATIEENHAPEHAVLSARFNYDAVFSTVMNRFICQLAIGHPLTVYGDGSQRTGLISLNDTVQNFIDLLDLNVKPGQHKIIHNFTHRLSIDEIAKKIAELDSEAQINYLVNPRKEPEGKLVREVEVHPIIKRRHGKKEAQLNVDLAAMIEFTKRHKDNIDTSIIMPKVRWQVGADTESTTNTEQKKRMSFLQRELSLIRRQKGDATAAAKVTTPKPSVKVAASKTVKRKVTKTAA